MTRMPLERYGRIPSPGAVTAPVHLQRSSWPTKWHRNKAKILLLAVLILAEPNAISASHYDRDPDALRAALVDAAANDRKLLDQLCRQYKDTVVNHFEAWRRMPEEFRGDEEQMKRYGEALFAIASHFESEGDRTLIGLLEGRAERNKIMNWGRIYNDAELLVDQNRCAEAIAVLEPIVDDTPVWAGTPIEPLAARVHGILGLCHAKLGDQEKALKWTYSAYELCVKRKDTDGIIAYSGNLAEIFHKLGDHTRFMDWLDATIGVMEAAGRHDEARALKEQHSAGR